ncbi:hypothetical protein [Paracoccus sp. IB05]|uniref:hypothetical protein n=1 Tax=Paracoccus sp. IB05 TaxID=2779367 RepID=UPI0018E6F61E|nr:hypothetical protein [Paracoccus sp. IB05]MBJ2149364.1 hypothetical protein [Paracoccus sp. IB05]
MSGLETYASGKTTFAGEKVDARGPAIRLLHTRGTMVVLRFNLFPHRTALEYVTEGQI